MAAMGISPEIAGLIDEIRNDKTNGASHLARQAIEVLSACAEQSQAASAGQFLAEHEEAGGDLMSARPSMAPLYNIVDHFLVALSKKAGEADLGSIRRFAVTMAEEMIDDSLRAADRVARHGSGLIVDGDRVITHSYSSTVAQTLKEAFARYRNIEVMVTRSGPGGAGEEAAAELAHHGLKVTYIDDTAVGLYLSVTNKAIVGADTVCADGGVVNGIGTFPLSLAAKRADVPLYVLCDTLKFNARLRSEEVILEEKGPAELAGVGALPPEVAVRNPYFDITPLELISGIVTEDGLLTPEEVMGYLSRSGGDG